VPGGAAGPGGPEILTTHRHGRPAHPGAGPGPRGRPVPGSRSSRTEWIRRQEATIRLSLSETAPAPTRALAAGADRGEIPQHGSVSWPVAPAVRASFGWADLNIVGGARVSVADAYLPVT
jgi:hypothetical protein